MSSNTSLGLISTQTAMLRTFSRAPLSSKRSLASRRSLHDQGIWGYQQPTAFVLPDFTASELANRNTNATLLRLVESYRVSPPPQSPTSTRADPPLSPLSDTGTGRHALSRALAPASKQS